MQLLVEDDEVLDGGPDLILPMSSLIRGTVRAMEYDPTEDFIYWIDRSRTIKRARSDGANVRTCY